MQRIFQNKFGLRQWLFILLTVTAIYVLLPQAGILKQSLNALKNVDIIFLASAVLLTILTYPVAALTYYLLARKRLQYGRTVLVQFASMFANRLLPAGIGGMGVNYAYLRKSKHNRDQAISVVAANNILGAVAHIMLVALLLSLFSSYINSLQLPKLDSEVTVIDRVVVALIIAGLGVATYYRQRIIKQLSLILRALSGYRKNPWRVVTALFSSMLLTICNVASLYFCVLALDIPLAFAAVFLIFTFGVALGASTPTPGGLGGVEAGLVAGMLVFHVPSAQAVAAVLAYRLISYWGALVVGSLAFIVANRRSYF